MEVVVVQDEEEQEQKDEQDEQDREEGELEEIEEDAKREQVIKGVGPRGPRRPPSATRSHGRAASMASGRYRWKKKRKNPPKNQNQPIQRPFHEKSS